MTYLTRIEIRPWIERGIALYFRNFLILFLASMVTLGLSLISFGLLFGPMIAGLVRLTLSLTDPCEEAVELGIIYSGLNDFRQTNYFILFWALVLTGVYVLIQAIPIAGLEGVFYITLFFIHEATLFGIFLIVDKQKSFWAASVMSIQMAWTKGWPLMGVFLIASILGGAGLLGLGMGIVFTLPAYYCIVTIAYRNLFDEITD